MTAKTMKASRVYGINDMRVETVERPDAPDGSILVKVRSCAICGTDRRIYKRGDFRAGYPVIPGHEIAGEIAEVSRGLEGYKTGERVCVAPGHGCGTCVACLKGRPNVCADPHPSLGYKLNGGFAEYIAVPEHILRLGFVNKIPDNLSFDEASLSEITACCINAQENTCVRRGDTVLIMGAGPAGIIHAILSKHNGADKVIMTQRSKPRLELAKALFPDVVDDIIVSSEENLRDAAFELTGGLGADAVFVCAPSREAQEQAFDLVASRGRINFFGGLPPDDKYLKIDANNIHYKELFVSGASSSLPESNRTALKLISDGIIDAKKLITSRYELDDIIEAFDASEKKDCIKIIINP